MENFSRKLRRVSPFTMRRTHVPGFEPIITLKINSLGVCAISRADTPPWNVYHADGRSYAVPFRSQRKTNCVKFIFTIMLPWKKKIWNMANRVHRVEPPNQEEIPFRIGNGATYWKRRCADQFSIRSIKLFFQIRLSTFALLSK